MRNFKSMGRAVDYCTFVVPALREVQIDLTSDEDSYLYLIEGLHTGGEKYLEANDNSGVGVNARVKRTLDAGVYTVVAATVQSNATGTYSVLIREVSSGGGSWFGVIRGRFQSGWML